MTERILIVLFVCIAVVIIISTIFTEKERSDTYERPRIVTVSESTARIRRVIQREIVSRRQTLLDCKKDFVERSKQQNLPNSISAIVHLKLSVRRRAGELEATQIELFNDATDRIFDACILDAMTFGFTTTLDDIEHNDTYPMTIQFNGE